MTTSLSGKVALVTGASGIGMGRSIALTLAREGARVVVNYRSNAASAQEVVAAIEGMGAQAIAVQADVFDRQDCARLTRTVLDTFGTIDICVINPGSGWNPEPLESLAPDLSLEDLNSEVAPLYNLMPLVLPGMYRQHWGRLITIALNPHYPSPAYSYNTAKAARLQAMLLAASEPWKHGVTANVIAPGPVNPIPGLQEAAAICLQAGQDDLDWIERPNISPQDIAEGVRFLCSSAGQYITGCVLPYAF
jgi:3-oxoacyl-[acyl-carrier protein] reductase